jgi:hypothetical protein
VIATTVVKGFLVEGVVKFPRLLLPITLVNVPIKVPGLVVG